MKHIGRIKVVIETEELMDCVVVCPHCGTHTTYGSITYYCGSHGCPSCHMSLRDKIEKDRTSNYDAYVRKSNNHDYEPYKYVEVKTDE